jgi:HD-GYP domain-containing protein (c-di-GMP phosphodiesterase class II)
MPFRLDGARILAISNAYDEIYLQLISAGKGDNIHNKILIELNKHVGINLDPRIFAILQGITF